MFEKIFQFPKLVKYATASKKWLDLLEFDIRNISTNDDQISCTISFPEKLTGNDGIIHGGIICFIMDSIAGIHAQLFSGKSGTALTKNISVDFLIPVVPKTPYTLKTYFSGEGFVTVELLQDGKIVSKGVANLVFK
jgi:acyl-coenzyme A thioesterase PaaI-like protein